MHGAQTQEVHWALMAAGEPGMLPRLTALKLWTHWTTQGLVSLTCWLCSQPSGMLADALRPKLEHIHFQPALAWVSARVFAPLEPVLCGSISSPSLPVSHLGPQLAHHGCSWLHLFSLPPCFLYLSSCLRAGLLHPLALSSNPCGN